VSRKRVTIEDLWAAHDWLGNYEAGGEVTEPDGSITYVGTTVEQMTPEDADALVESPDADMVRSLLAVRAWIEAEVLDRRVEQTVRRVERARARDAADGKRYKVTAKGRDLIRARLQDAS
jgi:hypothetical protein